MTSASGSPDPSRTRLDVFERKDIMSTHAYPVRVDAALDSRLSRWLWLVKWILAIPHYVVLVFLWLAFTLLSAFALVAILFTGRYPRGIFDFNVGVLRWSWRVAYYAYGGLGTDQYPPFSLEEKPDYPAHLEIEYPEHLSRGLVLVKWWLLAIPHYLVVGLFLGGGLAMANDRTDSWTPATSGGLIGLLVLVAAVVLAFTGSYPRGVFDLVLGMNRWVLRVAAYAGLMTDEYPPFRLDMGGTDPGTSALVVGGWSDAGRDGGSPVDTTSTASETDSAPPATAAAAPASTTPHTRWGAGRVIAVVSGAVLALTSLGLLAGGAALKVADEVGREGRFLMGPSMTFTSPGYAATSQSVDVWNGWGQTPMAHRWLGTVKVRADATIPQGVFVGIARTPDVNRYLRDVAHSTMRSGQSGHHPKFDFVDGTSPRDAPGDETFWVASTMGTGRQTLTWPTQSGSWTLVVMNRDGTTPVAADVTVGATLPILGPLEVGLVVAGGVLLAIACGLLFAGLRSRSSG
jgi:hypothetical protein